MRKEKQRVHARNWYHRQKEKALAEKVIAETATQKLASHKTAQSSIAI